MWDAKAIILALMLLLAAVFVAYWARVSAQHAGIGFLTNFFDTLGIGSFATTTTMYKMWELVRDQHIPGTLNIGHALPTVTQALIYITIIDVDILTLVLLILSAVGGSWIGASIVAGLPRRAIQRGMGVALVVASVLMALTALNRFPGGGEALALSDGLLIAGCAINFALGALMTLGIGLYAPCMIMVSLLGMNPVSAFPIMMGSCAFLMPVASVQFIRRAKYDVPAAVGLAIGGVPAVLAAAFIVRSLSLNSIRWLVVVVVVYAAVSLLRASGEEDQWA